MAVEIHQMHRSADREFACQMRFGSGDLFVPHVDPPDFAWVATEALRFRRRQGFDESFGDVLCHGCSLLTARRWLRNQRRQPTARNSYSLLNTRSEH